VLGYEARPDYGGILRDAASALFAFAVDQRGCLIDGSASFSSCVWAVGRLHSPGPGKAGWLEGFEEASRDCARTLEKTLRGGSGQGKQEGDAGENQRPVRAKDVRDFSRAMARDLAVPDGVADHGAMRVVSVPVFRRRDGTLGDPEPVILSSLIAADLQRVRDIRDTSARAPVSAADVAAEREAVTVASERLEAARDKLNGATSRTRDLRRELDRARGGKQRNRLRGRLEKAEKDLQKARSWLRGARKSADGAWSAGPESRQNTCGRGSV